MNNDQIYNKPQDVQFKQSSVTEINNDGSKTETQHLQLIIESNSPDISLDDYKKTISQISPVEINKDSIEYPFELAQSDDTSNDIAPSKSQHHNNSSIKSNSKSSKQAVQPHSPNEDDNPTNRQRSLSSSSSSSTDSSKSNDNQGSNIPYEILHNDEDDDDDLPEHANETTNQVSS